jgi:hypothetical protein
MVLTYNTQHTLQVSNTEKLLSIPDNIKNTPSVDVYIKMYKVLDNNIEFKKIN